MTFSSSAPGTVLEELEAADRLLIQQVFKPISNEYRISIPALGSSQEGPPLLYVKQKRMKIKEDIRFRLTPGRRGASVHDQVEIDVRVPRPPRGARRRRCRDRVAGEGLPALAAAEPLARAQRGRGGDPRGTRGELDHRDRAEVRSSSDRTSSRSSSGCRSTSSSATRDSRSATTSACLASSAIATCSSSSPRSAPSTEGSFSPSRSDWTHSRIARRTCDDRAVRETADEVQWLQALMDATYAHMAAIVETERRLTCRARRFEDSGPVAEVLLHLLIAVQGFPTLVASGA